MYDDILGPVDEHKIKEMVDKPNAKPEIKVNIKAGKAKLSTTRKAKLSQPQSSPQPKEVDPIAEDEICEDCGNGLDECVCDELDLDDLEELVDDGKCDQDCDSCDEEDKWDAG